MKESTELADQNMKDQLYELLATKDPTNVELAIEINKTHNLCRDIKLLDLMRGKKFNITRAGSFYPPVNKSYRLNFLIHRAAFRLVRAAPFNNKDTAVSVMTLFNITPFPF